jgi:hypothetical protein
MAATIPIVGMVVIIWPVIVSMVIAITMVVVWVLAVNAHRYARWSRGPHDTTRREQ